MGDTKTPSSRSSGSLTRKRGSVVSRAGRNIVASMLRRADIQTVKIDNANAANLTIDEVMLGASSIDRLTISDLKTLVKTGRVSLDNVIATVRLVISVDWQVNLIFTSPGDSFEVGSFGFDFNVGDVDIPALETLDISISEATANESVATVQPIADLTFNGGQIDDIEIMDIRLPSEGYGLDGIAFNTFNLSHIGVPDATVASVRIGSLNPNGQLTVPATEIRNIGIADVQVPAVRSRQAINVPDIQTPPRGITLVNIGLLRVRIIIAPTLDMNIGSLTLEDIEASSTISSVRLENMRFPLSVKGIELSDISIGGLRANQISL